MADDFGTATADTTFGYADAQLDPRLRSDDDEPSPVWTTSQQLRELIERRERKPSAADRRFLKEALLRQTNTLGLYRQIRRLVKPDQKVKPRASLYLLLFPGEGKHNTGIKDLNDKVLGYNLTSEFVLARQKEIETLFPPDGTGPRFAAVGQDYKTAAIFAVEKDPTHFAAELVKLDEALRVKLLEILRKAKSQVKDPKKQKEIDKLTGELKKKGYRFDFLFGMNTLELDGLEMDMVFRLLTEATKGAAMARYAAKVTQLQHKYSRGRAGARGVEQVPKGHDARGRAFDITIFHRVADAIEGFRQAMRVIPAVGSGGELDLQMTWVNGNWIEAFLETERLFWANPDVIRDVRKRLLERPPARNGQKLSLKPQVEMLELFLILVNLLDFVKEFVAATEYLSFLHMRHRTSLDALEQLEKPTEEVNWDRLANILSRDHRDTRDPFAVLGRASEYLFYSYASDHPNRIIFSMDIRDLGVELATSYEVAMKEISDFKRGELKLLDRTLLVTDPLVARKRVSYTQVLAVFEKYHGELANAGGVQQAVDRNFGGPVQGGLKPPVFPQSLQILLGGDEIFVAAHPSYAAVEHKIIAELADRLFEKDRTLNMRTSVAYSSARRPGGRIDQRTENQRAHDRALRLAAEAHSVLKVLERTHRRLELLIEKLENNDKKAVNGQFFRNSLGSLGLLRMYVRVKPLADAPFRKLLPLLQDATKWLEALDTTYIELVRFDGKVVDTSVLQGLIDGLEKKITTEVDRHPRDNHHLDLGPLIGAARTAGRLVQKFYKYWDSYDKAIKRAKDKEPKPLPPQPQPIPAIKTTLARR